MPAAAADEFLSQADLRTLTGQATVDGQACALQSIGIPYLLRQAGRRRWLVVSRYHLRQRLEGRTPPASRRPDLSAAT